MPHKIHVMLLSLCVLLPAFSGCAENRRQGSASTRVEPTRQSMRSTSRTASWPTKQGGALNWSSMAFPTGDARSSAVGIEKGMPDELRFNQPFSYEMVVTNLTPSAISNVVVSDECSSSFRLTSSDPPAKADAGGVLRWALGSLRANESTIIRVTGVPVQEGAVQSCTAVSYDPLMCAAVPVRQPKLQLTLSGPDEALICEKLRYRFTASNPGSGEVHNVMIDAPLPRGLKTSSGRNKVQFDVGTLKAGESRSFFVEAQPEIPGRIAYHGRAVGDGGLSTQSQMVSTQISRPVLTISQTCSSEQFMGRNATMDIAVTNTGDAPARDAVITQLLPDNARFVQASDGGRLVKNEVRWELGVLPPGATKRVSVLLTARESGTVASTAAVAGRCAARTTSSCQIVYKGIPAILLEVVDAEDPIEVGGNVTYVITATNQGTAPDTNIRITCTLEEATGEFVSTSGASRGNKRGSQIVFDPLPVLSPKQKAAWNVVLKARQPGDTRFHVEMQTDQLTRPVVETEATKQY